jgi:hypothetical protein
LPEENWDAFEGVTGKPLLHLIGQPIAQPQPWSQVRFWIHDLANEIAAAEKDGTLPSELSLDRVWITGEGRAKLLDFTAPRLESVRACPSRSLSGSTIVAGESNAHSNAEPPRLRQPRAPDLSQNWQPTR